jgi:hypothetical protein
VVLRGGEITRAFGVASRELADCGLVERTLTAREYPGIVDQVLDHRLGV